MSTFDLQQYIMDRLKAFDPTIDLSEGSPAMVAVVEPLVRKFTPDPFEMDIDEFITTLLSQEYPEVNFREGSGIRDLLIKPASLLLEPLVREIRFIRQNQSLSQPELLSPAEADALVANLFISRSTGNYATGRVRAYFSAPMPVVVGVSNLAYTASGLRFVPSSMQSISAEAMLYNQEGNLYYMDINYTAENPGSEYNVSAGEIVGIMGLSAAVRVTNPESFSNGLDEESTEELIARAETSITERSLVVPRGVVTRLHTQFEDLKHIQVIGYGDPEMQRDLLVGGDLGPALLSGNDGYTEDDGDGDETTAYFTVRYTNLLTVFGSPGSVSDYYLVTTYRYQGSDAAVTPGDLSHVYVASFKFVNSDVGRTFTMLGATNVENNVVGRIAAVVSEHEVKLDLGTAPFIGVAESGITWMLDRPGGDFLVSEVLSASELKLSGELPVGVPQILWVIRKREISISDVPGGIVLEENRSGIKISPGKVHIGGCTDFYVRGTETVEASVELLSVSSESWVVEDTGLAIDVDLNRFVRHAGKNFVELGVKVGDTLVIEDGSSAGTYTILRVGEKATPSVSFYYANEDERLNDPNLTQEDLGKFAYQEDEGSYWKLTGVSPVTWAEYTVPGYSWEYLQVTPAVMSTETGLRYKIVNAIDVNLVSPRTIRGNGDDARTLQLTSLVTTEAHVDFTALGTEVGDTFEILEGDNKGKYRVTAIGGTGNSILTVDRQFLKTANDQPWILYKQHTGVERPLVRVRSISLLDSSGQLTGDTLPYAAPIDARSTAFSNAGRGTKVSVQDAVTGIVGTVDLLSINYPLPSCQLQISINNEPAQTVNLTGATGVSGILNSINSVYKNIASTLTHDGKVYLVLRSRTRWIQVLPGATNAVVGLDNNGEDNRQIRSASVTNWESLNLVPALDVVTIEGGDNIGVLYLVAVSSSKLLAVSFDESAGRVRFLQPNIGVPVRVGSRSYGKARVYFLDPTVFQVRGKWRPSLRNSTEFPANAAVGETIYSDEPPVTYFKATVNGAELRFVPDPALSYQLIPAPEDDYPNNLLTTAGSTEVESLNTPSGDLGKNSRSAPVNFLTREVQAGDILYPTYQPIQGTEDLASWTFPATNLTGKTLLISIDNGPQKTLTFSGQATSPEDVAREINRYLGVDIAFIEAISPKKYLRLETDYDMTLFGSGTANAVLGLPTSDTTNKAAASSLSGYTVAHVSTEVDLTKGECLVVSPAPSASGQAQHFKVVRPGVQRIHPTAMAKQTESGLYYMDVELVSEGSGDEWNLDAGAVFLIEGYYSEGYKLVVQDPNFSYSTQEEVTLLLTQRALLAGTSDKPEESVVLWGQNLSVNYDYSPLARSVQSFASSSLERVTTASILVRHLQPHYIYFTLEYQGGSSVAVIENDIARYLDGLSPDDRVEASEIQNLALRRGATYVKNPIELVAVAHAADRTISVDRSIDYVTKGRLATFFPGVITVVKNGAVL